ncbi:hypothetical protein [Flavobacterium hungaricum]|uniref:Lipoprotein n=1 Tax=Flavobacterium hungaricum TaxID=2082725 RepID=A0ABR9TN57_9FLAO|nr:hypothetical protein [Flavobacterium hungaricum]MBE8726791.1 hypothetical protein [Flavobacterium hungaricum]
MKKTLIFFFTMVSCKTSVKNYEGYIYEYNTKKPLSNIEICIEDLKCVKTNKKGFFKTDFINSSLSRYIYLYANGELIDSIETIRGSGGEKINFYFINGRKDTSFIDMEQKKIIRQ